MWCKHVSVYLSVYLCGLNYDEIQSKSRLHTNTNDDASKLNLLPQRNNLYWMGIRNLNTFFVPSFVPSLIYKIISVIFSTTSGLISRMMQIIATNLKLLFFGFYSKIWKDKRLNHYLKIFQYYYCMTLPTRPSIYNHKLKSMSIR